MLKQIKINKLGHDIRQLRFYTKCASCSMLHLENCNSLCVFCKKYLHYIREPDLLFFTVKNIIMELAVRKEDLNFSHYDFLQLEKDLIEISDSNPAFTYNKSNMMWYIDFDFFNGSENNTQLIFDTCDQIYQKLFQQSYFNMDLYSLEKDNLRKKIEDFDSTRSLEDGEKILMLNFPAMQMRCKYKGTAISSMFRDNITRNFFENLSFYHTND